MELLEGVIVEMSPQGVGHAHVVGTLNRLLVLALDGRCAGPSAMFLHRGSDVAARARPWPWCASDARCVNRTRATPSPVVEVAESSLAKDRGIKARLCAAAGVLEYWVVDLQSMRIEVRTGPKGRAYAHRRTAGLGDTIRLVAFPDVEIRVADVLR